MKRIRKKHKKPDNDFFICELLFWSQSDIWNYCLTFKEQRLLRSESGYKNPTKYVCFVQSKADIIIFSLNLTCSRHDIYSLTSFSGGRSWTARREPLTMGKQLVNFIACGCESSAPFFVTYKAGREPMPYW
jgi:hypothetical protein